MVLQKKEEVQWERDCQVLGVDSAEQVSTCSSLRLLPQEALLATQAHHTQKLNARTHTHTHTHTLAASGSF